MDAYERVLCKLIVRGAVDEVLGDNRDPTSQQTFGPVTCVGCGDRFALLVSPVFDDFLKCTIQRNHDKKSYPVACGRCSRYPSSCGELCVFMKTDIARALIRLYSEVMSVTIDLRSEDEPGVGDTLMLDVHSITLLSDAVVALVEDVESGVELGPVATSIVSVTV